MDAAALAISICAFLLSVAGFGWTIFEWQRSGARLRVEITSFVTFGGFSLIGGGADDMRWMIAFDISNSGRTATTVHTVGFLRQGGGAVILSEPAIGANPLPKRLEPGESFNFPVQLEDLLEKCRAESIDPLTLVPYANTGHGQFKGKWLKVAKDMVETRD